jgi:hypothetical protein
LYNLSDWDDFSRQILLIYGEILEINCTNRSKSNTVRRQVDKREKEGQEIVAQNMDHLGLVAAMVMELKIANGSLMEIRDVK